MKERHLQGIGISPGVAVGKAFLLKASKPMVWMHRIPTELLDEEVARFLAAVAATRQDLLHLKEEIGKELGTEHAYIFDAHLLMLEDPILVQGVEDKIRKERVNAEFALQQVISELSRTFRAFEDTYLRERTVDVLDVGNRVQVNLCRPADQFEELPAEPSVLVAHELAPSQLAAIDSSLLLGIAMDVGGQTTHTGLLARSKSIPAVVGLRDLSAHIKEGSTIIVDGNEGLVITAPNKKTVERYTELRRLYQQRDEELQKTRDLAVVTTDDFEIALYANIEMPEEWPDAFKHGAKGVGLYRSEFVFLNSPKLLPTEDEHEAIYRKLAEAAGDYFVNVRTLDLGGEKGLESLGIEEEPNPALGLRAIRYSLSEPALFKTQMRGILRASAVGNLRVMVPMISGITEFRQARELLEKCKKELKAEGIPFKKDIQLGAMIEVPSAALTADILAAEADFVTVGTNDLIQYILAIDRSNVAVAYLYEPFHPAVLRVLDEIANRVHSVGENVGMCGEMAADPFAAPLLVGMGYDELSMNAVSIPIIKNWIRTLSAKLCRELVNKALKASTAEEVRELVTDTCEKNYPSLFRCNLDT